MALALKELVSSFEKLIGPEGLVFGEKLANRDPGYCHDAYAGGLLLRPETTGEVAAICREADSLGVGIVPHGGLTGLVDATATTPGQIAVSLERMNRITRLDPDQGVAVVQAGVTLEALASAAADHDLRPGVDLPSRGSCTIGGMASTNAGGIQAIRYGMMRDNILGLTAVLASGEVLELNNTLAKNNAGYDLKQLFVGSEGSLGLITEIVLKLHPTPRRVETAYVAFPASDQFPALLRHARQAFGERLLSFEAMWPDYVGVTGAQPGAGPMPLAGDYAAYGLVEIGEWASVEDQDSPLEQFLGDAFQAGLIADAVIAQSDSQRESLWRLREDGDAILARHDRALTYDIGLEIDDIAPYIDRLRGAMEGGYADVATYFFGHVGDGNLHVMLGGTAEEMTDRLPLDALVYDCLSGLKNTTVSAEHGIGLEKKSVLGLTRSPEAVSAMRQLKAAFDPRNTLNPGKVL